MHTQSPFGARVIQVIETQLEKRGQGVAGDPVRRVRQYWTLDGLLLAEVDDWEAAGKPELSVGSTH